MHDFEYFIMKEHVLIPVEFINYAVFVPIMHSVLNWVISLANIMTQMNELLF